MPWKKSGVAEERWRFLQHALKGPSGSFAAVCRRFGVSRKTGYKWKKRWLKLGCGGLIDGNRRPRHVTRSFPIEWQEEVARLHRGHYRVGARKIRTLLRRTHSRAGLPAVRTIHRWLHRAGLVRPVRCRPGPVRVTPKNLAGRRVNDVWTLDFKGWFWTGAGQRVQLFTVRDLRSRYLLAARHLKHPDERSVARCLGRLFRLYGTPRAIRVDHGAPFCGDGPRRWSHLSATWIRAGIAVQITRRAKPQDNGAHEQMHRVLKADTASPPARSLAQQQRRTDRWRRWYNEIRPHDALHQSTPASLYQRSPRAWPSVLPALTYRRTWPTLLVDLRGYIFWAGQRWQIGRAFHGHRIGLRQLHHRTEVYFGPHLLGTLVDRDHLIRPVRLSRCS